MAATAILLGLLLFLFAGYLASWPYRRAPARSQQLRIGRDVALALAELVALLQERARPPA
jgi:hypothetical protein